MTRRAIRCDQGRQSPHAHTPRPATGPFVIGTDNRIYSTWWHDPGGWAGWFNVSGGIGQPGGQVAALSRFAEHIDLFTVGSDGIVYSTWWDGATGWASWFQLGIT